MNKDFAEWLAGQAMPMFNILWHPGGVWESGSFTGECWEVMQDEPRRIVFFECPLDELFTGIQAEFKWAKSAVGELAIKRAIEDLRLKPWWRTAGPMTEEMRYLLREGFKNLERYHRPAVLRSPVKQLLNQPLPQCPPT